MTVDFDHTSFAVPDALATAHSLRRKLGATPIAGEALPQFRYLLLHVGDAGAGARFELLEPVGRGFLSRFLDRRGAGPHHITFTVPDLRGTVARVRDAGVDVVGEDYGHPSWQEAFLPPDDAHGIVIQLAQTDRAYPTRAELVGSTTRRTETFPSSRGATDASWWEGAWSATPQGTAVLGATRLSTRDVAWSGLLFGDILGGRVSADADGTRFTWPNGSLVVRPGDRGGVTAVEVTRAPSSRPLSDLAGLLPAVELVPSSPRPSRKARTVSRTTTTPAYRSVNPATGEVLLEVETASDEAVAAAVTAGDEAFAAWRTRPVEERAAVVAQAARLFEERSGQLARLASLEMGKPLAEALEEVEFCVAILEYYAANGPRLLADQPLETADGQALVQRLPVGVLLGVMPWNFPYYQVARFAAPNLVAGNTILLKHAESVPQCARAIEQLLTDAGLISGAYQNIFASHDQVERIIADRRVQGVSLTGSERAGAAVASIAGAHLKKCVLELGGSDPYVVLDADDVPAAAALAWQTRLYNTGQACNSNKRMIVMEGAFSEFVAELTRLAQGLEPGDPLDLQQGAYAPLSSRSAAEALAEQVEDAVGKGARLLAGGQLAEGASAYFAPAVLTGVTPEMRAYREELFGPVAVVYEVASDEEALRLANDSDYGLGGAVFSADPQRAFALAQKLDVGMANVNTPAGEGAELPFGGVKRSGFGRELGPLGMDEFVNKRLMYVAAGVESA